MSLRQSSQASGGFFWCFVSEFCASAYISAEGGYTTLILQKEMLFFCIK